MRHVRQYLLVIPLVAFTACSGSKSGGGQAGAPDTAGVVPPLGPTDHVTINANCGDQGYGRGVRVRPWRASRGGATTYTWNLVAQGRPAPTSVTLDATDASTWPLAESSHTWTSGAWSSDVTRPDSLGAHHYRLTIQCPAPGPNESPITMVIDPDIIIAH